MFSLNFGDFARAFLSVLLEGVPFILVGALISGLVDVFVSSERISKILPRSPAAAIFGAGFLGIIFPICECGSVVVVRRFIKKGLPLSVATTYMLAAPIVSPIVALSTWKAFTGQDAEVMLGFRMGLGFLVAVVVGLVVHQLPQSRILQPEFTAPAQRRRTGLSIAGGADGAGDNAKESNGPPDFAMLVQGSTTGRKLALALQSAVADFLDVMFYFIIGVGITTVFVKGLDRSVLDSFAASPVLSVLVVMAVAALFALCSTSDAFVAAVQFSKFSTSAQLAFMLFGPVFDLKLFWLYGLIYRRKFVICLGIGLFILIATLCILLGFTTVGTPKPVSAFFSTAPLIT